MFGEVAQYVADPGAQVEEQEAGAVHGVRDGRVPHLSGLVVLREHDRGKVV